MSVNRNQRFMLRGAPANVLDEIEREGWTIEATRGNHARWTHPTGAFVFSSATPSDHRKWVKHLMQLRRARQAKRP